MGMLITWALYSAAMMLVAKLLKGFEIKGGIGGAIGVAALFGLLNWALSWLITFALGVLTLSLAWALGVITQIFVVAIILKLTDALSSRLKINGFGVALVAAAIIVSVVALVRRFLL